ncbi:MAG: sugar transferase [Acidobacteria bacterium]|nr:sugar transferase [Acidobacteriota bacterium]
MRSLQVRVKYGFDRVVAALLLVALSPLLGLIAIAVKLQDGGPVIFRHQRPGLGARPFDVWKFRTMIVDADRFLDESGSATIERVTRVGRTMRRLSLDELPQLFNILRGEMSFVGPRPAIPRSDRGRTPSPLCQCVSIQRRPRPVQPAMRRSCRWLKPLGRHRRVESLSVFLGRIPGAFHRCPRRVCCVSGCNP